MKAKPTDLLLGMVRSFSSFSDALLGGIVVVVVSLALAPPASGQG